MLSYIKKILGNKPEPVYAYNLVKSVVEEFHDDKTGLIGYRKSEVFQREDDPRHRHSTILKTILVPKTTSFEIASQQSLSFNSDTKTIKYTKHIDMKNPSNNTHLGHFEYDFPDGSRRLELIEYPC